MTSKESEKQTTSKLKFKGQTFDMAQMDATGKPSLNVNGADSSAQEKKKTNLVFKKSHDFNPEAMTGGESKQNGLTQSPSIPQFTPTAIPYIPTYLGANTMTSPQTNQYNAINAGTPMPNGGSMMSTPMMYWPTNMMIPQMNTNVGSNGMPYQMNGTMPSTPVQNSSTAPSLASTPTVQFESQTSDKLKERWREKMMNQKAGEAKVVQTPLATVVQKTEIQAKVEPKIEEPVVKEEIKPVPAKADVANQDDSSEDSGDSGAEERDQEESEEEDFSHYPQERPSKIIYNKDMILEFINKEAAREDKDLDDQFDDLMRDITIVNKSRDVRDSKPRGGGGGGRRDYRGGGRMDKPKYPGRSEYTATTYSEPKGAPATALQRQKMTSAEKKRYQEIKQSSSDLLSKAKTDDTKTRQKKEINLYLFQLTPENYDEVSEKLKPYCYDDEGCQNCVHMLIDKAWAQTKYTEIYARLCSDLGSIQFGWFDDLSDELKAEMQNKYGDKEMDCQKIYKSFVLTKVRKEFNSGFIRFKERMAKAESNEEYSDEDKTAEYNKAKGKVLANMSFIGELYKRKYLPHKVMRTITYQIIHQFIEDYCKEETVKTLFSTSEVFVESFFSLMEICGEFIESKEKKDDMKKNADQISYQKRKAQDYSDLMMSMIAKKTYNKDDIARVISDDDRKNLNPVQIVFHFMRTLKESKKISARLSSLIENAEENRRKGWRLNRTDAGPKKISDIHREAEQKRDKQATQRRGRYEDEEYYRGGRYGDRNGGRGGRYEDADDYYRKDNRTNYGRADPDEYVKVEPTTSSNKSSRTDAKTTDGLIKAIFGSTKSAIIDDYTPQFTKDNKDIENSYPEDVLTSFFKHYTECSAAVADIRAAIPATIVKSFSVSESQFFTAFVKSCNDLKYEDIPVLKKSMGKILAYMLADCGFKVANMTIEWPADQDDKDELKFFMEDVIEEAEKGIKALERDAKIVDELTGYAKSSLK